MLKDLQDKKFLNFIKNIIFHNCCISIVGKPKKYKIK